MHLRQVSFKAQPCQLLESSVIREDSRRCDARLRLPECLCWWAPPASRTFPAHTGGSIITFRKILFLQRDAPITQCRNVLAGLMSPEDWWSAPVLMLVGQPPRTRGHLCSYGTGGLLFTLLAGSVRKPTGDLKHRSEPSFSPPGLSQVHDRQREFLECHFRRPS